MCARPSGSSTSAATICVPATVATGSTPPRFRFRYHAATAYPNAAPTTISPPISASVPPPASTPSSIPTPTIPIATPARLRPPARCSPLRANASRKVKIGAVATRMPVSDEEIRSSPSAIRLSGTITWTNESTTTGPGRSKAPRSTSRCSASGTSTSAASTVRTDTIAHGDMPSSRPTLMKRYEEPQTALSTRSRATERRDTPPRFAGGLSRSGSSRAARRRAAGARGCRPRPPASGRSRPGLAARRGRTARTASRTARLSGT
jgi:hypothetical protein